MEIIPYASAVESLMYPMMYTRLNICYAMGLMSRYQSNPSQAYWKAMKRILKYLKCIMDCRFYDQGNDLCLLSNSDVNWGGNLDEHKSTSGYALLLNECAIYWNSKKQICTALSTIEAEFIAYFILMQEVIWLKCFLKILAIVTKIPKSVIVYCDSQAIIAYVKDPKYHGRTKHIDIKKTTSSEI